MLHFPCDSRHLIPIPPGATAEYFHLQTRRQFFGRMAKGLGGAALASLGGNALLGGLSSARAATLSGGGLGVPHVAPKAKRAIFLFMGGAPSQIDMFDYKPQIANQYDKDLPASVLGSGQKNASNIRQSRLPVVPSPYKFQRYGKSGAWVSDL